MRHPHNGVLLPVEMDDASEAEKDAYAARVKRDNARFVRAVLDLEDAALSAGVDLDA